MPNLYDTNPEKVLDLLNERLTFEREGVKLYDAIIRKIERSKERSIARMADNLREHRDEEKEHEEWLEAQIREVGGDAHATTARTELVKTESRGLEEVVRETDEPSHLLHALMTAELADNAGWDLLVQIADEADDDKAKRQFKKRLHEEEEHLVFVRRAMERLARREILGERVAMPTAP